MQRSQTKQKHMHSKKHLYADITGIILTKMDGTAKGGIAVAIHSELGIPVKYIGVGETIEDLQKFDSNQFVNALFEVGEEKSGC